VVSGRRWISDEDAVLLRVWGVLGKRAVMRKRLARI
jgi:hypothetical protein